jgi:hypothetical protein
MTEPKAAAGAPAPVVAPKGARQKTKDIDLTGWVPKPNAAASEAGLWNKRAAELRAGKTIGLTAGSSQSIRNSLAGRNLKVTIEEGTKEGKTVYAVKMAPPETPTAPTAPPNGTA